MIYTQKIQQAIDLATKAHYSQKRKGKTTPYIVHPLSVGIILARVSIDEDVIVAGLLHDTIEDGNIKKGEIANKFGKRVAEIVNDVTEQDKKLPWEERKRLALEHIPQMSKDSLLVKSADFLNNLSDLAQDIVLEGDNAFNKFNASKEKKMMHFGKLISALRNVWKENPLLEEIGENMRRIRYTPQELEEMKQMGQEFVDALNKRVQ